MTKIRSYQIFLLPFILLVSLAFVIMTYQIAFSQNSSTAPLSKSNNNWTGTVEILTQLSTLMHSNAKININDAINNAIKSVGEGSVVDTASLTVQKGFLIYEIIVFDKHGGQHRVLVDAGDGRILTDDPVPLI